MSRVAEAHFGDLLAPLASPEYPADIPREVCDLFEKLALQVNTAGHLHYSADAVLHRIRWEYQIERGDKDFTCNNNWTSTLARWFLARHPRLAAIQYFSTRERRK